MNYRREAEAAAAVVGAVEAAAGGSALAVAGDLWREDDVAGLFDAGETALGAAGADLLSGCTASARSTSPERTSRRGRRRGGFRTAARSSPSHRKRPRLGSQGEGIDFAAFKGSIDTLTIGLARERRPLGIRVNAVRPRLIETDIHRDTGDANRIAGLVGSVPSAVPGRRRKRPRRSSFFSLTPLVDIGGGR